MPTFVISTRNLVNGLRAKKKYVKLFSTQPNVKKNTEHHHSKGGSNSPNDEKSKLNVLAEKYIANTLDEDDNMFIKYSDILPSFCSVLFSCECRHF